MLVFFNFLIPSIIPSKLSRIIRYGIFIFISIAIVICASEITSRYLINWNKYSKTIIGQLEKSLNASSISISNINGSIFPLKININNVYLTYSDHNISNNTLLIPKLEIGISIPSIIFSSPKIKKIKIHSVDLKFTHLKKILNTTGNHNSIKHIQINEGKILLNSDLLNDIIFEDLDLTTGNSTYASAAIKIGDNNYKTLIELSSKTSKISIDSELVKLSFNGKNKKGKLIVNGSNLTTTIENIIKPISVKTKIMDTFSIDTDINWSEQGFDISNFSVVSDNININTNLKHFYKEQNTDLNITINTLNLDALLNSSEINNYFINNFQQNLKGKQISKAGSLTIKAMDIMYNNDKVNNLLFNANIDNGITKVKNFTFDLPGETKVNIVGNIYNNEIISKFNGNISMYSKNAKKILGWGSPIIKKSEGGVINLDSKISITPNVFSLSNLKLSIDNSTADASIFIRQDNKQKQIKGGIEIENLDLDDYTLNTNNIINKNTLHNIISEGDFDVNLNNTHYNNNNFDNISLIVLSNIGKIYLKQIKFNSKKLQLGADVKLSSTRIDSIINANIEADYIDSTIVKLPKIFTIDYDPDRPNVTWLSQPIKWFGLSEFNGNIQANIKKLDTANLTLNNTKVHLGLSNKLLSINKFYSEVGEGKINVTANIGMELDSSTLLSFSLNNINLPSFMKNSLNINAITAGRYSCAGSIKSQGNNINQLIKNTEGKIKISSRGIKIKDFDIDTMLSKIQTVNSISELATLTKVMIFSGDTNMEYLNGAANIKNGIAASSINFKTQRSTGIISSNFSLTNFHTHSLMRFFFLNEKNLSDVLSIDMDISGPVWLPKISFNDNKIYSAIKHDSK